MSKKKAIIILEEIYHIALNATLTGSLMGPGDSLFHTYNKIREYAIKNDWIEENLVMEISEETMTEGENWISDTGISAKIFAKILEEEE